MDPHRTEPAPLLPTAVHPATDIATAPDDTRVIGYQQYAGMLIPVIEQRPDPWAYARPAPRDLTPRPLIDPIAARLLAGGVGLGAAGAGVGWGLGQVVAGLAVLVSGGSLLALALLLAVIRLSGSSSSTTHTETHIHSRGMFSRANTTIH
ncbi:hypothetical protein ACIP9H_40400 [Streptomyces sp. NPDC088732]|uniref:hypothetical protein n=1 Tax=Streptomyces sp. NPDC088732 TaxID=3365879 RepID=UPI00382045A1